MSAYTWCKRTPKPGEYLVMDRRTMRSVGMVIKDGKAGWSPIIKDGKVLATVRTREAAENIVASYAPDGNPYRAHQ